MHPARSVIFFTCLSGAGYGLLFLLALGFLFGYWQEARLFGGIALAVALALIAGGLLCSTLHLKHPERAWRAVTQWRSSWLSREGVAALATFLPAGLFFLLWPLAGDLGALAKICALLSALGAVATVVCTAMIYASLKPIRQWQHPSVPWIYLLFALATGAAALAALESLLLESARWAALIAGIALLIAWGAKFLYWLAIDKQAPLATTGSATGLGHLGEVSLLEAPHTEENYLLREMGFQIARKHSDRLRKLALIVGADTALGFLVAGAIGGGWIAAIILVPAALMALLVTLIERWLFFAEAKHSVTLYYGRAA